ncbi:hypothetical protein [Nostoc sp.]|uniref:hypothetical protein n=1 Tax=Nostoc sp. TaxID=1180 RepID=UPI002FFB5B6A
MERDSRLQGLHRQLPGFTLSLWNEDSSQHRFLVGCTHRPTLTAGIGVEFNFEVAQSI